MPNRFAGTIWGNPLDDWFRNFRTSNYTSDQDIDPGFGVPGYDKDLDIDPGFRIPGSTSGQDIDPGFSPQRLHDYGRFFVDPNMPRYKAPFETDDWIPTRWNPTTHRNERIPNIIMY